MLLLLIYIATYVPFKTAFIAETTLEMFVFDTCVDVLFFLDVIINFISAYEDEDKNLVLSFKKIS
jgi:hypothetical protein